MVQAGFFFKLCFLITVIMAPLRSSAFVPLPSWIQTRRAVVNIRGTGKDCFKWAVLAGMHPVDAYGDRMSKYTEHVAKYDVRWSTYSLRR